LLNLAKTVPILTIRSARLRSCHHLILHRVTLGHWISLRRNKILTIQIEPWWINEAIAHSISLLRRNRKCLWVYLTLIKRGSLWEWRLNETLRHLYVIVKEIWCLKWWTLWLAHQWLVTYWIAWRLSLNLKSILRRYNKATVWKDWRGGHSTIFENLRIFALLCWCYMNSFIGLIKKRLIILKKVVILIKVSWVNFILLSILFQL
jgi:hypothetical protein